MPNSEAAALLRTIGKRVRDLRRAQGFTQESLSERMGISPGYLRRVEGGRENLTVESIAKLAQALHVDVWALLKP